MNKLHESLQKKLSRPHADMSGKWAGRHAVVENCDVQELEDRGEIHTDDCGFFTFECQNDDCACDGDPGGHCTSLDPEVNCRVGLIDGEERKNA